MSILIVDDSATQRLLLGSFLKVAGHTDYLTAESANDAFQKLALERPEGEKPSVDLILMDVSMPDMDGIEACRQIKATPHLKDIPIIMVTGNTDAENLQSAFAAGAIDYITKPVNQVELLARVRSVLRLKQEMDRRKAREQELIAVTEQLTETNQRLEQAMQVLDEKHTQLQEEKEKSEQLLLNILPKPVAERLKQGQGVIADSFPEVSVLFADIVDFTRISASISPGALVNMLNEVFSAFDRLAELHGLEKIKTIGDSYMLVGGLPTPRADHAEVVAQMALDMREVLANGMTVLDEPIRVRIGIHTGPVVAGVIGTKKFIYDLWGDTVNTASRMEAMGFANSIQVTSEMYEKLNHLFEFKERGIMQVKGKGEMPIYLLIGKKQAS